MFLPFGVRPCHADGQRMARGRLTFVGASGGLDGVTDQDRSTAYSVIEDEGHAARHAVAQTGIL